MLIHLLHIDRGFLFSHSLQKLALPPIEESDHRRFTVFQDRVKSQDLGFSDFEKNRFIYLSGSLSRISRATPLCLLKKSHF